jgi:hypothetical protein
MEAQLFQAQFHTQAEFIDKNNREHEEATQEGRAFKSLANNGRSLDLLLRYTTTARRNYDIALKTLRDLQKERRKTEAQNEPENAKPPAKPTTSKPKTPGSGPAAILHFPAANDQTAPSCIQTTEDDIAPAHPENGAINKGEC